MEGAQAEGEGTERHMAAGKAGREDYALRPTVLLSHESWLSFAMSARHLSGRSLALYPLAHKLPWLHAALSGLGNPLVELSTLGFRKCGQTTLFLEV